jgi:PilZ domain
MLPERPRARRFTFLANIEMIDVESERKLREQTFDLSLFGCQVKSQEPFPAGTKVRLKITYKGAAFTASGRIANVRGKSMGVSFTVIGDKDQSVLERWMAELRDVHAYQ